MDETEDLEMKLLYLFGEATKTSYTDGSVSYRFSPTAGDEVGYILELATARRIVLARDASRAGGEALH